MKIEGSTAFVTGANRGLGLEVSLALLERGAARVYAASRSGKLPERLEADARVTAIPLDITDPEQVEAAATAAEGVQLLVNNAGVLSGGPLASEDGLTSARRDMETNYFGTLRMVGAFAGALSERRGAVANVLSVASLAAAAGMGGYAASKAAALAATQALRAELADVAVHAVFPGPVDTDMVAGMAMTKASPRDVAHAILDGVEAGAEDIFPDPMAAQFEPLWVQGGKRIERMFRG